MLWCQIIPFDDKSIHRWKFKVNDNKINLRIGIDEEKCKWINRDFFRVSKETINYAYWGEGIKYIEGVSQGIYGKEYRNNDIIEMIFNSKTHQLSYNVNDEDQGILYDHVKQKKYRMAVSFRVPNESITLLKYTQIYE